MSQATVQARPSGEKSPELMVADLDRAIAYYRDRLGFKLDFVYQLFYASVSRDGLTINLKYAPNRAAEASTASTPKRPDRLDAHIVVTHIDVLYADFQKRGARIIRRLAQTPWGRKEFLVEDSDGYILCFSEEAAKKS